MKKEEAIGQTLVWSTDNEGRTLRGSGKDGTPENREEAARMATTSHPWRSTTMGHTFLGFHILVKIHHPAILCLFELVCKELKVI